MSKKHALSACRRVRSPEQKLRLADLEHSRSAGTVADWPNKDDALQDGEGYPGPSTWKGGVRGGGVGRVRKGPFGEAQGRLFENPERQSGKDHSRQIGSKVMLRYLNAGESHGQALLAVLEGLPAGLPLTAEMVNSDLIRRQGGYGRGGRMRIEKDQIEFTCGVRKGKTLGNPLGMMIRNKDWENWKDIMAVEPGPPPTEKVVTRPRPGHADLVGGRSSTGIETICEMSLKKRVHGRRPYGWPLEEWPKHC